MKNSTPKLASNRRPERSPTRSPNSDETTTIGKATGIAGRPNPLTPADCDLRDHAFIPLEVAHVGNSTPAHRTPPDARETAILLCCVSWREVPAASLPDDDEWLARCLGYWHRGKVDKDWADIRESALHTWIKCSDGRLYHPAVAAQARNAWIAKLKQRFNTECATIKNNRRRHRVADVEPNFDNWPLSGCHHKDACTASGEMPLRAQRKVQLTIGDATRDSNRLTRSARVSTSGVNAFPHHGEKHAMNATDISVSLTRWERERGKSARGFSANHAHVTALARMALTPSELRRAYNSAVANRLSTNDLVPVSAQFVGTFVTTHRSRLKHCATLNPIPNADSWNSTPQT